MSWQDNLIENTTDISALIHATKRIAVLGIKTEAQADQPSVYVPAYLQKAGFEIVPVPVYYPDATMILGEKVYRRLVDVPGDIDMVDVFRRSHDVTGHVEDILAKNRTPCGFNPASVTMPPRKSSPKPASKSYRTAD